MKNSFAALAVFATMLIVASGCGNGPLFRSDGSPSGPPATVARENANLRPRTSPLEVGAQAPSFVLLDQKDRDVSTAEMQLGQGTAILFIPGVDSPAARPAFDWAHRHQTFLRQQNLELLFITPNTTVQNDRAALELDLRLAFLSDPASWVARAFGLVPSGRPAPSTTTLYLIGPDGRVHYRATALPPPSELVMAARTSPGRPRDPFFNF